LNKPLKCHASREAAKSAKKRHWVTKRTKLRGLRVFACKKSANRCFTNRWLPLAALLLLPPPVGAIADNLLSVYSDARQDEKRDKTITDGTVAGLRQAHAEKTAIARNLELAEGRLQVGFATITDVHDARARHESAQAQEIEAENQLDDKREALRELTARRPEALVTLGKTPPLIAPEPADADKWIAIALDQNYALIAKRETQESAREEVKRLRAGHYPSLDLVGSRTHTDTDGSISGPAYRTDNRSSRCRCFKVAS
jgi:hypothetical protein